MVNKDLYFAHGVLARRNVT